MQWETYLCEFAASLARELGLDSTTVTRHVDDLETRGLVLRVQDSADRRCVRIQLTARATALLDHAEEERRGRLRDGLSDWSAEDRFVQRDDLADHMTALMSRQDLHR